MPISKKVTELLKSTGMSQAELFEFIVQGTKMGMGVIESSFKDLKDNDPLPEICVNFLKELVESGRMDVKGFRALYEGYKKYVESEFVELEKVTKELEKEE